MKRKKILMIAAMPFYMEKGSSLRVHSMAKKYTSEGYSVDLVCYPSGKDVSFDNLKIIRSKGKKSDSSKPGPSLSKIFKDVPLFKKAKELVKNNDYEFIQGEDFEGAFIGVRLSKKFKIPHVYDLHNPLSEGLKLYKWNFLVPFAKPFERYLYKNSSKVISNWNIWKNYLLSNKAKKVETIYDGVSSKTKRVTLPFNKYIAYAGNFERYQGVDLLIKAFSEIASSLNVNLVIVGDGKRRDVIESLIKEKGLKGRVSLLGRKSMEETSYVLKHSLLNVIPRTYGKQPSMKLIHYAKAGRPILSTDIECNEELRSITKNVYFTKTSTKGIANSINKALYNKIQNG